MFDNERDGNMRFSRTIIRYDGVPVWCEGITEDLQFMLSDLYTGDNARHVTKDDPLLDISPVPLGLAVLREALVYVSRTPARRWKQGLNRESVRVLQIGRNRQMPIEQGNFRSKGMAVAITGDYPSLAKAIEKEAKFGFAPFSREFGLYRKNGKTLLVYKTRFVGTLEEGEPKLHERFQYLTERLQEAVDG